MMLKAAIQHGRLTDCILTGVYKQAHPAGDIHACLCVYFLFVCSGVCVCSGACMYLFVCVFLVLEAMSEMHGKSVALETTTKHVCFKVW